MTARPSAAPLTVVLAEDEPLVRDYLRDLIEERSEFTVVAATANGVQAVAAVRQHRPDLLLLDVEMPGMTGVDVLGALGAEAPPAIFVTAYGRYSLQAFDLHAVDYVLKPVDEDRFNQALGRAASRIRHGHLRRVNGRLLDLLRGLGVEPDATEILAACPTETSLERIAVPVRGGWVFLDATDIDWVGGAGVYVQLHVGNSRYLLRETLRTLEGRLPSPPFFRVHRSAIVNVERICAIDSISHGDYLVHLADDTPIRVSRRYRSVVAALVRGENGRDE